MSNSFSRCNRPPRRSGLTLVEVVVGLVLLSSLAAGVIMAFSKHQRQIRRADKRLQAVAAADQLLLKWYGESNGIPSSSTGRLHLSGVTWTWKTQVVREERLTDVAMPSTVGRPLATSSRTTLRVIRLSLFSPTSREPDCEVEVVKRLLLSEIAP